MKHTFKLIIFTLAIFVLIITPVQAADGDLKWSLPISDSVYLSPSIDVNGTIYIGGSYADGKLYAVYPNGTLKWSYTSGTGIGSSLPAISSDGIIYFGGYDNLYAVYPNGTNKWTYITSDGFDASSPGIAFDGTIYIGDYGGNFYAVNPNGTEKWTVNFFTDIYSSPGIALDGTIYLGDYSGNFYALNSDNGSIKWTYTGAGDDIQSSPAIASDGTIYVGSSDNNLYALYPNGTEKWSFVTGNSIQSSPAIASDGTVYVGSSDFKLYAINPNGTEKWNYSTSGGITSPPTIDQDGTVYVGSSDDNLYAIYTNGTEKWNYATGNNIVWSTPAIAQDGTVYISSQDGKLYAFEGSSLPLQTQQDYFDGYIGSYHTIRGHQIATEPPEPQYPLNVNFSVDGSQVYTGTGDLSTAVSMPSFASEINTYLSSCVESVPGYCDVPLTFETSDAGNLLVDGLSINYNDGGINFRATIMNTGFKDTVLKRIQATTTDGTVCEFTPPYTNFEVGDFMTVSNATCPITCNNFLSFKATTTCATSDEFTGTPNGC